MKIQAGGKGAEHCLRCRKQPAEGFFYDFHFDAAVNCRQIHRLHCRLGFNGRGWFNDYGIFVRGEFRVTGFRTAKCHNSYY